MGSNEKSVEVKFFVDTKKKRVMFAVAGDDFVEILFSFLTLPLGTIARQHVDMKDVKVGSLTSLYESVINLNEKHFTNQECKDALVNPRNSSSFYCQMLKVNLDEMHPMQSSYKGNPVFLKSKAKFIISDDLNVVPDMLDSSIVLLRSLGVENINLLEEKTMSFGLGEFLNLLNWSLLTSNPLTNLVLGETKSNYANFTSRNSASISSNSTETHTLKLKLLVQKSNKRILCAQVENLFMELLFSVLTIPLGTWISLTNDGSSSLGIINLYNSISRLGDGKYLKSEEVKTTLLSPKLAPNYYHVTDFLPIYEENTRQGHFLKEQATFIVFNNLQVTDSSSMDTISNFNTLGVLVGDMEVLEVSIGEHEALLILKASLTSTSALNDCLNAKI